MDSDTDVALVLLSGGIDSTTALALACRDHQDVIAYSIDYGQRHKKEIIAARAIAEQYNVPHQTLYLGDLLSGSGIMLTDVQTNIPDISYDDIKGISPTYVPFRNGMMLSVLAAQAQKRAMARAAELIEDMGDSYYGQAEALADLKDSYTIYFGAHAEDAANWAYPDCTPEFVGAMANAIYIGSYQTTRLITPFVFASKDEIIAKGAAMEVPYELTWSCYAGEEEHCGVCPTCRARKEAFSQAGVPDPTVYAG